MQQCFDNLIFERLLKGLSDEIMSSEGRGGSVLPYMDNICAAVKDVVFKQFTLG